MNHTKEPWAWDAGDVGQDCSVPYCDIYQDGNAFPDGEGVTIARDLGNSDTGKANARRIVAAVNACAGIPTEALEADVVRRMQAGLKQIALNAEGEKDPKIVTMGAIANAILEDIGQ